MDAPNLSHLVFREGDNIVFWDMRDIAIVLGRNPSSAIAVLFDIVTHKNAQKERLGETYSFSASMFCVRIVESIKANGLKLEKG